MSDNDFRSIKGTFRKRPQPADIKSGQTSDTSEGHSGAEKKPLDSRPLVDRLAHRQNRVHNPQAASAPSPQTAGAQTADPQKADAQIAGAQKEQTREQTAAQSSAAQTNAAESSSATAGSGDQTTGDHATKVTMRGSAKNAMLEKVAPEKVAPEKATAEKAAPENATPEKSTKKNATTNAKSAKPKAAKAAKPATRKRTSVSAAAAKRRKPASVASAKSAGNAGNKKAEVKQKTKSAAKSVAKSVESIESIKDKTAAKPQNVEDVSAVQGDHGETASHAEKPKSDTRLREVPIHVALARQFRVAFGAIANFCGWIFPAPCRLWLLLVIIVVAADQATKHIALYYLLIHQPVEIFPWLNLTLTFNPGAGFSFMADWGGVQRPILIAISTFVSLMLFLWLRKNTRSMLMLNAALALILGGALGNLYDRALTGKVVDFISVYYDVYYYPAFNIADSAITIGAVLLIIDVVKNSRGARENTQQT